MPSFMRKPYQKKTFTKKPKMVSNPVASITKELKAKTKPKMPKAGKLPIL